MKNIIALLLLFFTGYTYAQDIYEIREAIDFINRTKFTDGSWRNQLDLSDIEGTPYLSEEFVEGTIFTTQKIQFQNVPVRYNVFSDNLEFRTADNSEMALAAPEIVEKVIFGDYQMTYSPYFITKKLKRGFFIVREEGKASLFERHQTSYQAPTKAAAYKDPEPAKFITKPHTYFIKIGQQAAVIVDNKKALLAAFPDHKEELETYIKKNKIKTSKVDKLIDLVKYYNSL